MHLLRSRALPMCDDLVSIILSYSCEDAILIRVKIYSLAIDKHPQGTPAAPTHSNTYRIDGLNDVSRVGWLGFSVEFQRGQFRKHLIFHACSFSFSVFFLIRRVSHHGGLCYFDHGQSLFYPQKLSPLHSTGSYYP